MNLTGLRARLGRALPESMLLAGAPQVLGYRRDDIPAPVELDAARVRLLIAPTNEAEQGHSWARAAERLPGVSAANLEVRRSDLFSDRADWVVPQVVFGRSRSWAAAHRTALAGSLTHLLVESERGVLGSSFLQNPRKEAEWLDRHGIARAYVSHGSDLRLPSRNVEFERHSPFRDHEFESTAAFEARAKGNADFLADQGRPVFVSTPDLLRDYPTASWLPVVIDPVRWRMSTPVLERSRPVVAHAPTSRVLKGTDQIEPTLARLHAAGVIEYRPIVGIRHEAMAAALADVDILLDSFRLGPYGVTSVEARAGRRLVVSHVADDVRDVVRRVGGADVPIVEADPESLEEVLRSVAADPDRFRAIAEGGPEFVRSVHDGWLSAQVLAPFLGVDPPSTPDRVIA